MFITQLLNRAINMMLAAIQKKTQTNKQTNKTVMPAALHHQHQMYVHAFSTLYDGRKEKGQTCEGLSSERPKNKQDKVLKDKKVIDKLKKGQNKMSQNSTRTNSLYDHVLEYENERGQYREVPNREVPNNMRTKW